MPLEPDARHVGVPMQGPRPVDEPSVEADVTMHATSVASTAFKETRDRERLERWAGVPSHPQSPEPSDPRGGDLPDEDLPDEDLPDEDLPDEEADDPAARAESTAAWWLDVLFSPVIFSITILFGAILLFMLLSEVFQFLQAVQSAPLLLRWLGYAFVVTLVAIASWAAIRLCCAAVNSVSRRRFSVPTITHTQPDIDHSSERGPSSSHGKDARFLRPSWLNTHSKTRGSKSY